MRERELLQTERKLRKRFRELLEPLLDRLAENVAEGLLELGDLNRVTTLVGETFDWAITQSEGRVMAKYERLAAERASKPHRVQ